MDSCEVTCHCYSSIFNFVISSSNYEDHWWIRMNIENDVYTGRNINFFKLKATYLIEKHFIFINIVKAKVFTDLDITLNDIFCLKN